MCARLTQLLIAVYIALLCMHIANLLLPEVADNSMTSFSIPTNQSRNTPKVFLFIIEETQPIKRTKSYYWRTAYVTWVFSFTAIYNTWIFYEYCFEIYIMKEKKEFYIIFITPQ